MMGLHDSSNILLWAIPVATYIMVTAVLLLSGGPALDET